MGLAIVQPGTAEYDTGLHVPVCSQVSNLCDCTALVEGRGPMGPEPHAPNTLDGCADGTYNDPSHHPEQSVPPDCRAGLLRPGDGPADRQRQ